MLRTLKTGPEGFCNFPKVSQMVKYRFRVWSVRDEGHQYSSAARELFSRPQGGCPFLGLDLPRGTVPQGPKEAPHSSVLRGDLVLKAHTEPGRGSDPGRNGAAAPGWGCARGGWRRPRLRLPRAPPRAAARTQQVHARRSPGMPLPSRLSRSLLLPEQSSADQAFNSSSSLSHFPGGWKAQLKVWQCWFLPGPFSSA